MKRPQLQKLVKNSTKVQTQAKKLNLKEFIDAEYCLNFLLCTDLVFAVTGGHRGQISGSRYIN